MQPNSPLSLQIAKCGRMVAWAVILWAFVAVNIPATFAQDTSSYLKTDWQLNATETFQSQAGIEQGENTQRSHSGTSSYRFAFQSQLGEELVAETEIQPCHLIRDLEPSLHVYSRQTGVQIMARVVLPETESPSGRGPMKVWISGNSCDQAQRWCRLDFGGKNQETLYSRFRAKLPVLRKQYGSQVSDKNAVVDAIAVKLSVGSGTQEVFIDSLQIDGRVSAAAVLSRLQNWNDNQQVQYQEGIEVRPSFFRVNGTVINYNDRPFCIRAIQYNGEPMRLFRELGFNTLWMSSPPTLAQLQTAKDNQLRLICPPPIEEGLNRIDLRYDPVLAWLVGDQVHWADQMVVRKRIDLIHQVDVRDQRPTIVRARTGLADYSRAADILCVGKPVLGTSFPLVQYSDFIKQRYDLTQVKLPMLAEIDTEIPDSIQHQVQAMSGIDAPLAVQPEQLRSMCFQAIAGGARGFLFRSQQRLDAPELVQQQRRLSLKWVNQFLDQLQPWVMGGVVAMDPQSTGNLRIYSLQSSASRILLVHQWTGIDSMTAGWSTEQMLTVADPGGGVSDQPYRLTPTGLVPATHQSRGHQRLIQIENASDWEMIVLTEDPQVIQYINQQSPGAENVVLTMEQAELTADLVTRLARAMVQANRDPPEVRSSLNRILALRQSLTPMATSDDPLAYWNQTLMLQREVATLRYRLLLESQQPHTWPTSSPLTTHPMAVPLHWQSVSRFSSVAWSPNGLPAGDFESLQHMVNTGWRHHSGGGRTVETAANLIDTDQVEGRRCLTLSAQINNNRRATVVEQTPIWINAAPVSIPANHLVRIAGYIKIDQPISGSLDGFTIEDSLGGEALQQRIHQTSGWQPFSIYRATSEPHSLEITMSLTGLGVVALDELTVHMVPIPSAASPTQPLDLPPGTIPPLDQMGAPATPVANDPSQSMNLRDR